MAYVGGNQTLPGTCGTGILYSFRDQYVHNSWNDTKRLFPGGGAGWVCAGFISGQAGCKEAYEDFKARWPIVLQTPKRRNNNSNNSFIFVVYDTRKKRKSKNNPEGKTDLSGNAKYSWPWKTNPPVGIW